eukprot:TRINITY_DN35173_c0_g1_i12.p1 TRINITY_DN35173_c0_g1~~TRINITY_DN35173_c0_g1_i12.p1  ORF type:complete len:210 (-),score=12.61 TRINITY_DN35173_c0_g1_i12:131-760(-)
MAEADTCGYRIAVQDERIANPAPLGLASFALTTFVLSAHNAGWAPNLGWMGLAFFYGGLGQVLAGQWEFKKDNVFPATAFTSYGCFWMGLAFFILMELLEWMPHGYHLSNALGWYLSAFLIFNSYMLLATTLLPLCVCLTFFLLECAFITLTVGAFQGAGSTWTKAGGYIGVFTAGAALYSSMASLFNSKAKKRIVFSGAPLLNFGQQY